MLIYIGTRLRVVNEVSPDIGDETRRCADIGMSAIDRPKRTCIWRTTDCDECYNVKLIALGGERMRLADERKEVFWKNLTGKALAAIIARKKCKDRFRLATRGECLMNHADVAKIWGICKANPNTLFWLPTRAWRDKKMRKLIEQWLFGLPNLRLLASIGKTTPRNAIDRLWREGWSVMFFGNDKKAPAANVIPWHRCAKTWRHAKGHCAKCQVGCFSPKQVAIWLKKH